MPSLTGSHSTSGGRRLGEDRLGGCGAEAAGFSTARLLVLGLGGTRARVH
jgi:hypothetical protein